MKKLFNFISLIGAICILLSCSPDIYQFRQIGTISSDNVKLSDKGFEYTDSNITISYNFWSKFGNVSFVITNNTDNNIYLLKDQCFFVQNGWAQDYYKNRTYVETSSIAQTAGASVETQLYGQLSDNTQRMINIRSKPSVSYSSLMSESASGTVSQSEQYGYSVETPEQKIICIPAHSSKRFSEFVIRVWPYRACGFTRDPLEEGEGVNWSFSSALDSPNSFENRLVFNIEGKIVPIVNKFYISKLTNIYEPYSYSREEIKDCNGRNVDEFEIERLSGSNKFYINYECEEGVDNDRIKK